MGTDETQMENFPFAVFLICGHRCLSVASLRFYQRDTTLEFLFADQARDGLAGLLKAGKIPEVRKITALLRLDGLHGAVVAFQKDAAAIRFFLQGQSAAIPGQPRELLDEIGLAQALERGEPRDLLVRQTHLSPPAAAGRATLAFVENWHAGKVIWRGCGGNLKIEFRVVLFYFDDVKVAAAKTEKTEAALLDQGTNNLLRAVKQKMLKKQRQVDYGKLHKDGYSNRFLAKLEEA